LKSLGFRATFRRFLEFLEMPFSEYHPVSRHCWQGGGLLLSTADRQHAQRTSKREDNQLQEQSTYLASKIGADRIASAMKPATSIYLDFLRFAAAILVVLYHSSFTQITNGAPGALGHFGSEAVIVFFVLSGYVIAHVTTPKGTTLSGYAIARLSRLWSVVIPALALTLLADWAGISFRPEYYSELVFSNSIFSYVSSALFINQIWSLHETPGLNYPIWSVSYEFWYYCIYGAWIYTAGHYSWIVPLLTAACAGPKILWLFPTWLLGVLAYKLANRAPMDPMMGLAIFMTTLLAVAGYVHFDLRIRMIYGPQTTEGWTNACGIAILTAGNIVAFNAMGRWSQFLFMPLRNVIHRAAGYTFSIYLFHYPLLSFFAALSFPWRDSWQSTAIIYGGTALVILLLGPLTEGRKAWVAERLRSVLLSRDS
jgi:peptidoglycan/LPS O-acetylase OafA/YrhL